MKSAQKRSTWASDVGNQINVNDELLPQHEVLGDQHRARRHESQDDVQYQTKDRGHAGVMSLPYHVGSPPRVADARPGGTAVFLGPLPGLARPDEVRAARQSAAVPRATEGPPPFQGSTQPRPVARGPLG